jgi:hypothetical protein
VPRTVTLTREVPNDIYPEKIAGYVYSQLLEDQESGSSRTLSSSGASKTALRGGASSIPDQQMTVLQRLALRMLNGTDSQETTTTTTPAITVAPIVIDDSIVVKSTESAISSVNTYVEQESKASITCFESLKAYLEQAGEDGANTIVEGCLEELGDIHRCSECWDWTAKRSFGKSDCTKDQDCFTSKCVVKSTDTSTGTETKRCVSPSEDGGNWIEPMLKCMFKYGDVTADEDQNLKTTFYRKYLGLTGKMSAITKEDVLAAAIAEYGQQEVVDTTYGAWKHHAEANMEQRCVGDWSTWDLKTEEACGRQKNCNWWGEAGTGLECTNPCHAGISDTSGVQSCESFCLNPTVSGGWESKEVSNFPTCVSELATGRDQALRSAEENCNQKRYEVKEHCERECQKCRYGFTDADFATTNHPSHDQDEWNHENGVREECKTALRKDFGLESWEEPDWELTDDCMARGYTDNDGTKRGCGYNPSWNTTLGVSCHKCHDDQEWEERAPNTPHYPIDCKSYVLQTCQDLDATVSQVTRPSERNHWRWTCIVGEDSYADSKETDCKNNGAGVGCYDTGGPQPALTKQCFGKLKSDKATHEACYDLGEGWFENKYPAKSALAQFFGGHTDEPPEHCHIKRYNTRGCVDGSSTRGRPYVRPPPYGYGCSSSCQKKIEKCMHCDWQRQQTCKKSWDHFRDTENKETGETFGDAFQRCEWTHWENIVGVNSHSEKKRVCAETQLAEYTAQFTDPHPFEENGCMTCHHWEWSEWEDHSMQCFKMKGLPDDCRWDDATAGLSTGADNTNTGAACANECHWEHCRTMFDDYLFKNPTKSSLEAQTQLQELNQCRMCTMVWCDTDKCQHQCDDFNHFHWWRQPVDHCAGCNSAWTDDNGDQLYGCHPDHPAYNKRGPWGEKPPYANDCPYGCENALRECRDEQKQMCWQPYNPATDAVEDGFDNLHHQCWDAYHTLFDHPYHQMRHNHNLMAVVNNDKCYWCRDDGVTDEMRSTMTKMFYQDIYDAFITDTTIANVANFCTANRALKYSEHACNMHPCCEWQHSYWDHSNQQTVEATCNMKTDSSGTALTVTECQTAFDDWRPNQDWWIRPADDWSKEKQMGLFIKEAFNQVDGHCWKCDGSWNEHNTWETKLPWESLTGHEKCLADVSAISSACSVCEIGCGRECWDNFENERDCTWFELNKGTSDSHWSKMCKKSTADAFADLSTNHGKCTECNMVRCDHDCSNACNDVSHWNWHEHTRRCGACVNGQNIPGSTSQPSCYPGADCWMGNEVKYSQSDANDDSTRVYSVPSKKRCFGNNGGWRALSQSETEAQDLDRAHKIVAAGIEELAVGDDSIRARALSMKHVKMSRRRLSEGAQNSVDRFQIRDLKLFHAVSDQHELLKRVETQQSSTVFRHNVWLADLETQKLSLMGEKDTYYNAAMRRLRQVDRAALEKKYGKEETAKIFDSLPFETVDETRQVAAAVRRAHDSGRRLLAAMEVRAGARKKFSDDKKAFFDTVTKAGSEHRYIRRALSAKPESGHATSYGSTKTGRLSLNVRRYLSDAKAVADLDRINKELVKVLLVKQEVRADVPRNLKSKAESVADEEDAAELGQVLLELGVRGTVDPYETISKSLFSAESERLLKIRSEYASSRKQLHGVRRKLTMLKGRVLLEDTELLSDAIEAQHKVGSSQSFLEEFDLDKVLDFTARERGIERKTDQPRTQRANRRYLMETPEEVAAFHENEVNHGATHRELYGGHCPQDEWGDADLTCMGTDCATQEQACEDFFVRTGAESILVANLIDSWDWDAAPWEDTSIACEEMNQKCFIGYDDAIDMLIKAETMMMSSDALSDTHDRNYVARKCDWKSNMDLDKCAGCNAKFERGPPFEDHYDDAEPCYWDCMCGSISGGASGNTNYTQIIQTKIVHHGVNDVCSMLNQLFEFQRDRDRGSSNFYSAASNALKACSWNADEKCLRRNWHDDPNSGDHLGMHLEWDASLLNGKGGCKQHGGDWVYDLNLNSNCFRPEQDAGEAAWQTYYDNQDTCRTAQDRNAKQCFKFMGSLTDMFDSGNHLKKDDGSEYLKFFQMTRRWLPGMLNTETTCEAESCYPDFWITDQSACGKLSYCKHGGCKRCVTENRWDREQKELRKTCVLFTNNKKPETTLTQTDCETKFGGTFHQISLAGSTVEGMCKLSDNSANGHSFPNTATGDTDLEKCDSLVKSLTVVTTTAPTRNMMESDFGANAEIAGVSMESEEGLNYANLRMLSVNTTTTTPPPHYYGLIDCEAFSPRQCETAAANTGFTDMQCRLEQWDTCRDKEECEGSGECDVELHAAPWEFHQQVNNRDKGMCAFPVPWNLDDFPIGYHHHWGHDAGQQQEDRANVNAFKMNNIHDWEEQKKLCQRVVPLGFIPIWTPSHCLAFKAKITAVDITTGTDTAAKDDGDTEKEYTYQEIHEILAQMDFAKPEFYSDSNAPSFSASEDYFSSAKMDTSEHMKWKVILPGAKVPDDQWSPPTSDKYSSFKMELDGQGCWGDSCAPSMTETICQSIAGKWIPKAFDKTDCIADGFVWAPHDDRVSAGTSGQVWGNATFLEAYHRHYQDADFRTTVMGSTTPPPVDSSGASTGTATTTDSTVTSTTEVDTTPMAHINVIKRTRKTTGSSPVYAPGTYACCTDWWESSWDSYVHCHQWSKNGQDDCISSGSKWMSITKFRTWARWIQNAWESVYSWQEREESPVNKWVWRWNQWQLQSIYQTVIQESSFEPIRNYIQCRGSPKLAVTDALTKALTPMVALATVKLEAEGAVSLGSGVTVELGTTRRKLSTEATDSTRELTTVTTTTTAGLQVDVQNAKSIATQAVADLPQGTTAQTSGNANYFSAACFSVVRHVQSPCVAPVTEPSRDCGTRTVGQLVGDCLTFTLPEGTAGNSATICLTLTSSIMAASLNSEFAAFDLGEFIVPVDGSTPYVDPMDFAQLSKTVDQVSGSDVLCGQVLLSGVKTFCPIRRYEEYVSTDADADDACPNIVALQEQIKTDIHTVEADLAEARAEGADIDMFGNEVKEAFSEQAFGSGSADVIDDVDLFAAGVTDGKGGLSIVTSSTSTTTGGDDLDLGIEGGDVAKSAFGEMVDAGQGVSEFEGEQESVGVRAEIKAKVALEMSVPEGATGESLMQNFAFTNAIASGLASALGVEEDSVTITGIVLGDASRRRGRRLSSASVEVSYTIVLPPSQGLALAAQLQSGGGMAAFESALLEAVTQNIAASSSLAGDFEVTGVTSLALEVQVLDASGNVVQTVTVQEEPKEEEEEKFEESPGGYAVFAAAGLFVIVMISALIARCVGVECDFPGFRSHKKMVTVKADNVDLAASRGVTVSGASIAIPRTSCPDVGSNTSKDL